METVKIRMPNRESLFAAIQILEDLDCLTEEQREALDLLTMIARKILEQNSRDNFRV